MATLNMVFLSVILLPEWSPALTLKNSMSASLTGCAIVIHPKMEILYKLRRFNSREICGSDKESLVCRSEIALAS